MYEFELHLRSPFTDKLDLNTLILTLLMSQRTLRGESKTERLELKEE